MRPNGEAGSKVTNGARNFYATLKLPKFDLANQIFPDFSVYNIRHPLGARKSHTSAFDPKHTFAHAHSMTTTIDELLAGVAFSEDNVLAVGIQMVSRRTSIKNPLPIFHSHFGSTPVVLANQFTDLQVTDVKEAMLTGSNN